MHYWGTALQAGRSWVRFPMVSLEFFIYIILPVALWPWGWLRLLTEMSTRNISWGKGGRCVGLTTLPPSCADCLEIWEPQPPGTLRAFQACNGIALPLPLPYMYYFIITQNVREILLNTFVPYYVLLITGRMLIFKILKIRISRYRCSYSTSDLWSGAECV